MRIVAGVTREGTGRDSLALARALASSLGAELVVGHVLPRAFDFPGPAHVDAEWRAYLMEEGRETLEWARREVGEDRDARFELAFHKSSGAGLDELAREAEAELIVIGSAPGADEGRIELGSTADRLLHGSSAAVAMAPFGYASWAPARIGRAVVAYQASDQARHALDVTLKALSRSEVPDRLRVALINLITRVAKGRQDRSGRDGQDEVTAALVGRAEEALAEGEAVVRERLLGVAEVSRETLVGRDVRTALARFDWADDDLMVVGSTSRGALSRVLVGSTAYKLINEATVPVCAVPRSAFR